MKLVFSVIVLVAAAFLGRYTKKTIRLIDDQIDAFDLSKHASGLLSQAVKYMIYAGAIAIILSIFGLTEALYTILTGGAILGFAIGYAAKDLLSNMLSGIIIAVDKPFKIDDEVEVAGIRGKAKTISLRTTSIITSEGVFVEIPNSNITAKPIKNYSR